MTSKPVVIFHTSESNGEYFLLDNVYKASYARLAEFAQKRKIDLRFVSGIKNYTQGTFALYGKYHDNQFKEFIEPFQAGLVFLKSRTSALDSERRVNNTRLENICRDKYLTYQTYPNLVKKTILPNDESVSHLAGEKIVLKPRFGEEGRNVQLVEKSAVESVTDLDEEFIAQEVIDSSEGISGILHSRHEMRIYVFNGTFQSAYIKIPAKNSFLANISHGASVRQLQENEIPHSVFAIIAEVDEQFSDIFPRLYTIDVMYEKNRPWIVELNDMPGLPDVAVQPLADMFFNDLLDLFVS